MKHRIQKFQFHYGTIKSVILHRFEVDPLYFNSTMVRLKESNFPFVGTDIEYFNSTMVRLKGVPTPCVFLHAKFQFHYGTIKRMVDVHFAEFVTRFQFHYGTIKRGRSSAWRIHQLISIPLWYD